MHVRQITFTVKRASISSQEAVNVIQKINATFSHKNLIKLSLWVPLCIGIVKEFIKNVQLIELQYYMKRNCKNDRQGRYKSYFLLPPR